MTAPGSLPLHALTEDNLAAASPDLLRAMVKTFADALISVVATACLLGDPLRAVLPLLLELVACRGGCEADRSAAARDEPAKFVCRDWLHGAPLPAVLSARSVRSEPPTTVQLVEQLTHQRSSTERAG